MSKQIVLFDMDGTLTEPRQKFNPDILDDALYSLTNKGIDIGIVTGSGLNYLKEQMGDWLQQSACRYRTHLLPCNGTQYLKPPKRRTDEHTLIHQVSMESIIGDRQFRELVQKIIQLQSEIILHPIPLSGHFIDYRGSMLNWCPIGRDASRPKREEFVQIDKQLNLRNQYLSKLVETANTNGSIMVKLGGDTSFDIYPIGWDKTYALNHFEGYDVWFVGDRCDPTGNDYELFKHCAEQGFRSISPEGTKKIIKHISKRIGDKNV